MAELRRDERRIKGGAEFPVVGERRREAGEQRAPHDIDRDAIGEAEEEHLRNRRRHPPRGLCAADHRTEMVEQRPRHMVEHPDRKSTRELQSLMRLSYAVFCLKKKIK